MANAVEYEGVFVSQTHYPGAEFAYKVHIPAGCERKNALGLHIAHDGLAESDAFALDTLASQGRAPYCVSVGIFPGRLPSEGVGEARELRMMNYDMFTCTYPDFVADELTPYLIKKYNLSISPDPDLHMISGGSSGGVSAWNIAFSRPDFAHRVYMSSPSFLSMGRGRELPALMRKYETLPIRIYMEYSEEEPDEYFGSSYCAGQDAYRALLFAGYDVTCDYYPGEGHCSRHLDKETALKREAALWKDWDREPVRVKKLSPRMEKLISAQSAWTRAETMPAAQDGPYTFDRTTVYYNGAAAADGYADISAVRLSADGRLLYISDKSRGCVFYHPVKPDGGLGGRFVFAALHMPTDFVFPGAYDLCVGSDDRVYAATELGIQAIRSFGLVDVIVPLPERATAEKLALSGGDEPCMFAQTARGIYRRRWLAAGGSEVGGAYERRAKNYYD